MSGCRNLENVGQVEELLLMTEQMQDELDQKDQRIMELNRQLSESLTLNEKLNNENRTENIEALRTRLRKTEERLISETDSRKRADAEVVAWKFKYEKAEQEKLYAQTHQKTVEIPVEKKVPYEKCEKCDRTAYQKAKEKYDNRKSQLEKKYKNMTVGYESILFLLAWYSVVMGILFLITEWLIIGIGYQIGKIYRKYCWDIISIMVAITSTAIAIYFGDWIKSVISINLITLLLLVHVAYIGIRCYVKDWLEEREYY